MADGTGDSPTLASTLTGAGGTLAGRYRVRARLGRGASKEVYLAYDERLDREVALAIVVGAASSDSARARVTREAQVTGRLGDHPNVITVYDIGEHDGIPYLVLRAMGGGSLASALARERPQLADVLRIGREIAAALAHAHAHGVVHRDVKPDNVWLATDGSAALGDFGIAHLEGAERLTAEGIVVGTVRYLSPEQIRGEEVGPASDLYALGVTLYELVTGVPPFTAADATQVLTQHLTVAPVAPSQHVPAIPPALERLIIELLAKEPQRRPASAGAVVAQLAALSAAQAAGDTAGPAGSPSAPSPPLRPQPPPGARRLVAVLAARADVADPEVLHGLLDRCGSVVEQHGGSVERHLGDGLVGIFGLTESHGDDALRAARAAIELRAETAELRLGLESGEVFLGGGPRGTTVATGTAITAAGGLAERAAPGEILLGPGIRPVVAPDATIEGERGRLLELRLEQPALLRTPATPFVGRAHELAALHAAFAQARDERACRLVTVAGAPGIGKSRLAGEFVAGLREEATVLAGRCLAYGEGTTYRALADIVRGLGGDPRARIEELLAGDGSAVRGVLSAVGLSDEPAQPEETAWALRRLLERLARDRPLVVAIEDIHWARPALLELLDHLVALSSGSPILLVCLTRPELLETRPAWSAPQPNRSVLVLDALGDAHARELAEELGAGELAARIARRAEGNPLFVEQLVAVDAGQETSELPVSIQAVLAARIDQLGERERMLLQHAAVEGRTFHAGGLGALLAAGERGGLPVSLVALARKGLIAADQPEFPGEDAFRFTHALIREAAYAGLSKGSRAELHANVAQWLETQASAADEIVGYHLERACQLAAEIGRPTGEGEDALARRAAQHLQAASNGALARGDPGAAVGLLERAVRLVASEDAARGALLPALGASLHEAGRLTEAIDVLDEAIGLPTDARIHARAQVERETVRLDTETSAGIERGRSVADAVLPVLEREGDVQGQCRARSLRARVAWIAGRVSQADDDWRQAAEFAARASDERELYDVLAWRATAAVLGPTPVDDAILRCEGFRERVAASPAAVAWMINPLASLHAMKGELPRAEALLEEANATISQLGSLRATVSHHEALVMLMSGQYSRAEAPLRAGLDALESMNDQDTLATTAAMLAQTVYAQGRLDEAAELCRVTAAAAAAADIVTQVIWRGVAAKVLVRHGERAQALALARAAVALVEPTDLLSHHGDAMLDLADVLGICSRARESREAIQAAIALYERKGNVAAMARTRLLTSDDREE